MNAPRVAKLALTALIPCLVLWGLALFLLRGQIGPPPAPPAPVRTPKPRPAPPPPPTSIPKKSERAPRSTVVSWEGIGVEPCASDLRLDLMVRPLLGRLDQDLLAAVKDLKDASGLFPVAEDRVTFLPVSRREASFSEPYGVTPGAGGVRVELPLEPAVLAWWPARAVLASALAEAILVQEVPAFADAPAWLRHGVALHLSRFGPIYSDRAVLASASPPQQLVRALAESGDLTWLDGYWAVRALSARAGEEAVKRWVQGMFEGRSWTDALKAASGETPEAFESQYRAWTSAQLRDRCANRQDLLDAVALLRLQREAEVIPTLDTFVRNHPLDLYAGNAKYFLNYARFRNGDYEAAINGFTDLLVNAPATTSWQGKAQYFLGRTYQLAGYRPLAVRAYMLAALDPDSDLLRKLAKQHLAEVEN